MLVAAGCVPRLSGPDSDRLLAALFAPPTAAEVALVETEWAARDTRARDVRVEQTRDYADGSRVLIVTHTTGTDAARHVGAVRLPPGATGRRLPVLLVGHGGDGGASLGGFEPGAFARDWVQVLPAFRGERLRTGLPLVGGGVRAGGTASPWDRDVDDALALLGAALDVVPEADAGRIAALGRSRGAGVVLLAAARDRRVRGVVSVFGPTDFFLPDVQRLARRALRVPVRLPGAGFLADSVLFATRDGRLPLPQARLALLRRSPAWFAARLPPVQMHHGARDTKVPVAHSERLADALRADGGAPELFVYAEGRHASRSLAGHRARAEAFLQRVVDASPDLRP
ncbi:MAG TPA: prolyl oligopeptidase family serine peptidase [Rubricoccaceae bacterium]